MAMTVTGELWLASPFFSAPLSDPPQPSPPLVLLFLIFSLAFQSCSRIWIPSYKNSIAQPLHCMALQLRDLIQNLVSLLVLFPVWFLFAHGELRWVWRALRNYKERGHGGDGDASAIGNNTMEKFICEGCSDSEKKRICTLFGCKSNGMEQNQWYSSVLVYPVAVVRRCST